MEESRRTRYTKTALQNSLMELMKTRPVQSISVKEICALADINRSTFYAHFDSTESLLRAIERETLAWFSRALNKFTIVIDKRDVIGMFNEILLWVEDNKNSVRVLLSGNGDADFQRELFNTVYETPGLLRTKRGMDEEQRRHYMTFITSGSIGMVQYWLKTDLKLPRETLAEMLYTMAFQAFDRINL